MTEAMQNEIKESILTEKDIRTAYFRWYNYCEISNSYERMQTVAFCYAISGILKKLYPVKEEFKAALQRHLNFFNSQGIWGSSLLGVAAALEEEKALGKEISDETIINVKTGLMGPMAGIGDTIDWGTWKPLFFSIAASFSINGGIAGFFICFLFALVPFLEGWYLTRLGYRLGRDAISRLLEGGWIKQLIMGSGILGLFMVGALTASNVTLQIPIAFTMGGTETTIQTILDSILPGLVPLALVLGIYTYFRTKGQKFGRVVFFLLALCMVGSLIGLF
ncbi:PTS system mannose/fructose/sorbose family transporter subunit IID [bacterium 1XD21-13]|nr:PTS system mannose/fructose/sorbose family transporter subunit IID [bacterium 1XD21-13]